MVSAVAAVVFVALAALVALFQLALAAGMPWGHLSMGGRFAGRYPPVMRGVAVLNAALLVAMALTVLVAAGFLLPDGRAWAGRALWGIVGFCAVGSVLNLVTPSRLERRLWAPVALLMWASATTLALVGGAAGSSGTGTVPWDRLDGLTSPLLSGPARSARLAPLHVATATAFASGARANAGHLVGSVSVVIGRFRA